MKIRDLARILNCAVRNGKGNYDVTVNLSSDNIKRDFIEDAELIDMIDDLGIIELKTMGLNDYNCREGN